MIIIVAVDSQKVTFWTYGHVSDGFFKVFGDN
jgi:hypothetical protein